MVHLYGEEFSKRELLRHVGALDQVASVRLSVLGDGAGRGVRVLQFRNGGRLAFDVLVDRGFDIGACDVDGTNVAFASNVGVRGPWYANPDDLGFLDSFGGGLLTTCGLDHAFGPEEDPLDPQRNPHRSAYRHPLHGKVSGLPATLRGYGHRWVGDECELYAEADVIQASMFGETLVLRRRISAWVGHSTITVRDEVSNESHDASPHMLTYHCNIGFPFLAEGSELRIPPELVHVQDRPLPATLPGPTHGVTEVVDEFRLAPATAVDWVSVGVESAKAGHSLAIRYRSHGLPYLVVWRMFGEGDYVLGLEPSTNATSGRAHARSQGELMSLAPGASVEYAIDFEFSA